MAAPPNPFGGAGGAGPAAAGGAAKSSAPDPFAGGAAAKTKKLGAKASLNPITAAKNEVKHMAEVLGVLGRPAEAVQALAGAPNLTTGTHDSRLGGAGKALLGEQYGVRGGGALNTVANLGLDIVTDPTILFSGGAKEASMGTRLLTEAGAADLAVKATTKAGLSAAEKATAKRIIAEQIEKGGAGDLAKRSLTERALGRNAGKTGAELATDRAAEGLIKEGRGGVRVAGHTVLSGETIGKAGDQVRRLPGVSVVEDAAKAAFVPRAGVAKSLGSASADTLNLAQSKAAGELETYIGDSVRPLKAATKANKITEADRRQILGVLEGGAGPVEPRLQGTLDELVKQRTATTAKIVDRGLLPLEHVHNDATYVPRIATDEYLKAITKAERKGALSPEMAKAFKVDGSLNARTFMPDAPLEVANDARMAMLKEAGVEMKKGATAYVLDPVKAIVSHGAAVERASGQLGVLEHLASLPGEHVVFASTPTVKAPALTDEIAKARSRIQTAKRALARTDGRLAAEGPVRVRAGAEDIAPGLQVHTLDPVERLKVTQRRIDQEAALADRQGTLAALQDQRRANGATNAAADAARKAPEGYEAIKVGEQTAYVHPELAKEINGVQRLVNSDAAITRFTRHVDEVQNFWRAQVTVLPIGTGFFARNLAGNVVLNAVDHVPLSKYAQAWALQWDVWRAGKNGKTLEDALGGARARLVRESETHNIYHAGGQEADMNVVAPSLQVGAARKHASPLTGHITARDLPLLGTERGPVQAGRALNAVIENNARLANFLTQVERTGHFAEAARRTRLTLFDYTDLTPFEQKVGRRVVPFYTFARKATGLLLRELAHNPAKINRITKVLDAGAQITGYGVDSPLAAAGKTLATPFTPGASLAVLGGGGYVGAVKQQLVGTVIQDKETGGYTTIAPGAKQSENRVERLANALLPVYGKFGREERARQRVTGGTEGNLRLLLGLNPVGDPVLRTPGGGQVVQSTSKAKTPAKKTAARKAGPPNPFQ